MNKVRFGLIGFGAWGQHHARAISECPTAELAAIVTRSQTNQSEARQRHPNAAISTGVAEMLARNDIEVVDVVFLSYIHFQVVSQVLQAGKHLLLEKPMAL